MPNLRRYCVAGTVAATLLMAGCQSGPSYSLAAYFDRTLNEGLVKVAPDFAKPRPVDRFAYHFVFLVNTSQAGSNRNLMAHVNAGIVGLLESQFQKQVAANVPVERRSRFSVFPYQLDLYTGRESVQEAPLDDKWKAAVPTLQDSVATRPDGKPYQPGDGSDNERAREQAFRWLESRGETARPTIVIQMTGNPASQMRGGRIEHPTGPSETEDGKGALEYGYLLHVSNEPVPASGPGGLGQGPAPLTVWYYLPKTLERADALPTGGSGFPWLPVVGGVVALGALVGAAVFIRPTFAGRPKSVRVKVGSKNITLEKGAKIAVWGSAVGMPTDAIAAFDDEPAEAIFQLEAVPGGVRVSGIGWRVDANAMGAPSPVIPLDKEKSVSFVDQDGVAKYVTIQAQSVR